MNASVQHPSTVTSGDRLGLTLFLAVVVHATVILGVTFSTELTRLPQLKTPPIEIRLVHQRSDKAPEKAEYLAQANLEGGGTLEEDQTPSSPAFVPLSPQQPGIDQAVREAASPEAQRPRQEAQPLTAEQAEETVSPVELAPETVRELPSADQLVARSLEIASLSAEIDQAMNEYAQRGQHRYIISAQAQEFRDAAYLDAWRNKIERVGNLNYPEEARRRNLSGKLLLDVAINADGSLNNVTLLRSSGHKVLDDAAMRIVRMAAPFNEFSAEMRVDTDVLHITRTWEFLDSQLNARGR